jgi:hypothetical protein
MKCSGRVCRTLYKNHTHQQVVLGATVQNFEAMLDENNIIGNCTDRYYTQKWIAKLYNYYSFEL